MSTSQKNRRGIGTGLMIVFFLLFGCQNPIVPPTITAFPDTATPKPAPTATPTPTTPPTHPPPVLPSFSSNSHFVWNYKPPEFESPDVLPKYFDVYILTHKDEEMRENLRAMGVKPPIYQYLLLAEIQDIGSCDTLPFGNQVAYKIGDFCQISAEHPDWFLLDTSGSRITYNEGMYFMDPGNQEFREFWLERTTTLQEEYGWDGLFIDNAEAGFGKLNRLGVIPAKYPDVESYQNAVDGFLQYIDQNFLKPTHRPAISNIIEVEDINVWFRYLQHLDGAMVESYVMDWQDGYYPPEEWEAQQTAIETAMSMGKFMVLMAQGKKDNLVRQQFGFASYLLINNGNAAFRYADADEYNHIWLYDNYSLDLGMPLGSRYRDGEFWRRDFANGYVLVDPVAHTGQIEITK